MRAVIVAGLLLIAPPIVANTMAQASSGYRTGSFHLSSTVDVTYLEADRTDGSHQTRWIQVAVLWRGKPGWASPSRPPDPAANRQTIDAYRHAQATAVLANAIVLGGQASGVAFLAEVDSTRSAITVLGQRLLLPPRDSALVVLIDRSDRRDGDPVVVGAVTVDGRLPDQAATHTWRSGDTLFVVSPRDDVATYLAALLRREPTVAEFAH